MNNTFSAGEFDWKCPKTLQFICPRLSYTEYSWGINMSLLSLWYFVQTLNATSNMYSPLLSHWHQFFEFFFTSVWLLMAMKVLWCEPGFTRTRRSVTLGMEIDSSCTSHGVMMSCFAVFRRKKVKMGPSNKQELGKVRWTSSKKSYL